MKNGWKSRYSRHFNDKRCRGGATLQSLISKVFGTAQSLNTAIDLGLRGVDCKYKINYNSGTKNYNKRKRAFTLAEVLITLGIIGVVAALTIPTLIANYEKKQTVSKLQKVYATLSNMTKMLYADGGASSLSGTISVEKTKQFFDEYVLKYFKSPVISPNRVCPFKGVANSCFVYKGINNDLTDVSVYTDYSAGRVFFTTADGISYFMAIFRWVLETDEDGNTQYVLIYDANPNIYVDLNGIKPPNTYGKDVYRFSADFSKGIINARCSDYTNDQINTNCSATGDGLCCFEKIRRDGWKIKDDYPWL